MAVSAHDVAAYVLSREGAMSAMKLQKLLYYSQAWHLVWADEPLFGEEIQAWANGPVVYEVFDCHRGQFSLGTTWPEGDLSRLNSKERATVDVVCDHYGRLSGQALSALTHSEDPWKETRGDLPPTARSTKVITLAAMEEFYGALAQDDDAETVDELDWGEDDFATREAREYEEELAREYEEEIRQGYEEDPSNYL